MDRKKLLRSPLIWIGVIAVFIFGYSFLSDDTRGYQAQPTSVALAQLSGGNVTKAIIDDKEQRVRLTLNAPLDGGVTQIYTQYPAQASSSIFQAVQEANLSGGYDTQVTSDSGLFSWLIYLLPYIIFIGIFIFFMRQLQSGGSGRGAMSFALAGSASSALNVVTSVSFSLLLESVNIE